MFTVQEELRWHAFWRVGFVAFAGMGSVAPSPDRFEKILASGGVGARFLVSKEYGVNLGIDGAINAQGEKTFYIMVGGSLLKHPVSRVAPTVETPGGWDIIAMSLFHRAWISRECRPRWDCPRH